MKWYAPMARVWIVAGMLLALSSVSQAKAQRIVALAPHLVEVVYALGAGDKLVAAVQYADYPEAAKALPRVGGYTHINLEALLRLKPDLVLAWKSGNGDKIIAKIRDLGVPVYESEPGTLESVATMMEDVSRLIDAPAGAAAVQAYRQQLQQLRQQYSSGSPLTVFYQVWHQPLQSLSNRSIVGDVINLCGGRNIFADAKAIAPKTNVESILRANPDAIVASGMGEARPQWLDEWRNWPQLKAVQQQALFFVPPSLIQRHSPRLLQGAEILCQQLQQLRQQRAQKLDGE
ncbi:MAG: cobalamin-binding protein [Cellvibrionaceae bacterium]|nr:cobalamin-binding protein [Cellvibrionaceae bacterium]